jgi:hypothetical protein
MHADAEPIIVDVSYVVAGMERLARITVNPSPTKAVSDSALPTVLKSILILFHPVWSACLRRSKVNLSYSSAISGCSDDTRANGADPSSRASQRVPWTRDSRL